MLKFARLLIDIPLGGDFPAHVDFVNDKGVIVRQPVTYEWKPIICNHCWMFGHSEDQCKKKGPARQEWRPKPPAPPPQDVDGFQPVAPRQTAKSPSPPPSPTATRSPSLTNSFTPLLTQPGLQQDPKDSLDLSPHG